MSISGYKRLTLVLVFACAGLLVLSSASFWQYGLLKVQVAFANEQTQTFEEMRTRALQSDVADAVGCLEYVVFYYPSGTKQDTGSRLDHIVERERAIAVRDILEHLRATTGEDLGESPDTWIRKYGRGSHK